MTSRCLCRKLFPILTDCSFVIHTVERGFLRCILSKVTTLQHKNAYIIRSTLESRPIKASLKCPYVCPYVRPSTKSFFDLNEIWHVGRG